MDYFEDMVRTLIEQEWGWVRQSVRINLTKKQKRQLGKPSMPRPEVDLLAFDQDHNRILVLEVKSYLDSNGISYSELQKEHKVAEGRYKIFTCRKYREMLLNCLRLQMLEARFANNETTYMLGLISGKIHKNMDEEIADMFEKRGWLFWGPEEIKRRVKKLSELGYANNPYVITTKVLTR